MKIINGLLFVTLFSLSACSQHFPDNQENLGANKKPVSNMQKVELGTIISVKTIAVKAEEVNSYGNMGITIGSGGTSGIYGTVDIATLGKLYRNATKPTTAQRFIIKRSNGDTVAITQASSKEVFKAGDTIKLLIEDGKAKVIH